MNDTLWEWFRWNLWQRWIMKWRCRGMTQQQIINRALEHWDEYLDASQDEPITKDRQEALNSMNALRASKKE